MGIIVNNEHVCKEIRTFYGILLLYKLKGYKISLDTESKHHKPLMGIK